MAARPAPVSRRSPPANTQANSLATSRGTPQPGTATDWGSAPKRSGVRSEVKLALLLVVTLAGAFGYLVHRKFRALNGTLVAAEGIQRNEADRFQPLAVADPRAEVVLPDPQSTRPIEPDAHPTPADWTADDLLLRSSAAEAPPLLEVPTASPGAPAASPVQSETWTPVDPVAPRPSAGNPFPIASATSPLTPSAAPVAADDPVSDRRAAATTATVAAAPAQAQPDSGAALDLFGPLAEEAAAAPPQAEPTFEPSFEAPAASPGIAQNSEPAWAEPSRFADSESTLPSAAPIDSSRADPFPTTAATPSPVTIPSIEPLPATTQAADDPFGGPVPPHPVSGDAATPVLTPTPASRLQQDIATVPIRALEPEAPLLSPAPASPTWADPPAATVATVDTPPAAAIARAAPGRWDANAGGVPAQLPAEHLYTVRPGDSYWSIAKAHYGSVRYFAALTEINRDRVPDPSRMQPGMQVQVPDPGVLEARYPQYFRSAAPPAAAPQSRIAATEQPGRFYVDGGTPMYRVGPGDTLSSIAQKHLGRASRWEQIFNMNRDVLPEADRLQPGVTLRLPHDASQVIATPDGATGR